MDTRKIDEIIWREDLYPRIKLDQGTVQNYADNIELLPPIEINQHNELIDGYHRLTAHKIAKIPEIEVTVTKTESDTDLLYRAIRANAKHGLQLSAASKAKMATKIYDANTNHNKDFLLELKSSLSELLSVDKKTVSNWVSGIDKRIREERKEKIFNMWLACHTQEDIAEAVGVDRVTITEQLEELSDLEKFPKATKLSASYDDADWTPQLYDVWNFGKNTNTTKHFGNTPVEIVDNLLYAFTRPFDIVIDPFAGGGSTIDICVQRLRRYWVSDRVPHPARHDIRTHDIVTDGISGPSRWEDVALLYLDPPYWKQAAGKYSQDKTDLANMPLDRFTDTLVGLIHDYAAKIKPGSHIACITSPTQWPNEDKSINYHDLDLACGVKKKLKLVRRAICPYSTEQYNGTQVDMAKKGKLWLVISRTLLVWERI